PLILMTEADNVRYSRHKEIRGAGYAHYDNYDAIEVPYVDAIPSDYDGAMGVPITFLDKYCPEQFEILGMCENEDLYQLKTKRYAASECKNAYFAKFKKQGTYDLNASGVVIKDNLLEKVYQRILIRRLK
ncbi:MAG: adenine-specific methyltransferase EcoRI family protein, partial [Bacteroidales bacterium]|nr:adenine-specific methyltransferase EcoRI family protein [Bacteroidales bacterium]